MHPLLFRAKRVHLTGLRLGKLVLGPVPGMTPARFDYMYLIRSRSMSRQGFFDGERMAFADLVEMLGLHHSTVSQMVGKLEALGWLTRTRAPENRRRTIITLTEMGILLIDEAVDIVFLEREHVRRFERHFTRLGVALDQVACVVVGLVSSLREIALTLGDTRSVECPGLPITPLLPDDEEDEFD